MAEDTTILEERLLKRLDQDGTLIPLMKSLESPIGRNVFRALGRLTGVDTHPVFAAATEARRLQKEIAETIVKFTPLGWAPTGRAHHEIYRNALDALRETGSTTAAEQVLVEGWNTDDRLRFAVMPVHNI